MLAFFISCFISRLACQNFLPVRVYVCACVRAWACAQVQVCVHATMIDRTAKKNTHQTEKKFTTKRIYFIFNPIIPKNLVVASHMFFLHSSSGSLHHIASRRKVYSSLSILRSLAHASFSPPTSNSADCLSSPPPATKSSLRHRRLAVRSRTICIQALAVCTSLSWNLSAILSLWLRTNPTMLCLMTSCLLLQFSCFNIQCYPSCWSFYNYSRRDLSESRPFFNAFIGGEPMVCKGILSTLAKQHWIHFSIQICFNSQDLSLICRTDFIDVHGNLHTHIVISLCTWHCLFLRSQKRSFKKFPFLTAKRYAFSSQSPTWNKKIVFETFIFSHRLRNSS